MEQCSEMGEAEERAFWLAVTESSLRKIWGDPGDDVYEELMDVDTEKRSPHGGGSAGVRIARPHFCSSNTKR